MEYFVKMSFRQWLALLCFYFAYLCLGTSVFYTIEHNLETERRAVALQERIDMNELLVKYTSPDDIETQNKILELLSDYCGRKVTNHTLDEYIPPYLWNLYHSFYFSFTTCTTVGYGNISPSTSTGRILLCFYALFGLPVSCFLLAVVGNFFETSFVRIYNQYKEYKYATSKNYVPAEFGLIGKICLYLTPGIVVFIFLPACLFTYFEDWDYVRSVYYSFVTLSTVGYGDLVPTFQPHQERKFGIYFVFYEIFIIVWNIGGLGYVLMLISFIAKGMKSKRMARLEHILSENIKATKHRVWHEVTRDVSYLRGLLNEVNMMKFKPVYTDTTDKSTYNFLPRSSSCPQLTMYDPESIKRKARCRSFSLRDQQSHSSTISNMTLNRVQSDSDLHRIDRKKTFEGSEHMFVTGDLLSKVVSALGSIRPYDENGQSYLELGASGGINGFSDSQILSSERRYSGWSLPQSDGGFTNASIIHRRASDFRVSDIHSSRINSLKASNEMTWNGSNSNDIKAYLRAKAKERKNIQISSSGPVAYNRSVSLNIPADKPNPQEIVNNEGIRRVFNKSSLPPKSLIVQTQEKRNSLTCQDTGVQSYLDRTLGGRESIVSLPKQYLSGTNKGRNSIQSILDNPGTNVDLLEKTSIADLIRALEVIHTQSNEQKFEIENDSSNIPPKLNNLFNHKNTSSRRGSLRPVPGYTTIFSSNNVHSDRKISSMSNPDQSLLSRHSSLRPRYPPPPYTSATPKPMVRHFSVRSSNLNTSPERSNQSIPQSLLLQKKLPHGPSPLARNDASQDSTRQTGPNFQQSVPFNRSQASTSAANKNITWRPVVQASRTRHSSLSDFHEKSEKKQSDS